MGTKHLKEGEKLLYKQSIDAPKNISSSALKNVYETETNRKFLGLPIHLLVGLYHNGERRFDPEKYARKRDRKVVKLDTKISKEDSEKKITNLLFRKQKLTDKYNNRIENGNLFMQWGEPIAVFDSANTEKTVERMSDYLFNHGYFKNIVTYEAHETLLQKVKKRSVTVKYKVTPGRAYLIDTVFFRSSDSVILSLLTSNGSGGLIKKGENYNQDNFTKERERIDVLLKENGYYDFSRQYIEFDVDTVYGGSGRVAVLIIINDPAKRGYHKKFIIDEVNFTTDAGINLQGVNRQTQRYHDNNFHFYERNYNLKILSQRLFVRPGDHYNRTKTFNSQRQLANLDVFKFVNINYDTAGGKFKANIFTSALDRYQWSNEVGLSVTQGFPGPFININFKKRNIFRGMENFEMNGRIGYEGVASATETGNIYQSVEAGVNASVTFPQFLLPLKEETRYRLGRINPRTKALVGFNYTDRPEYQRAATTFNYIYSWENERTRRFDFTLTNLSIINSTTDPTFQDLLDSLFITQGNTLYLTFEPSFVSSMIFSMAWNHNNYGNLEESSVYIRWSLESGGTFQGIYDFPGVRERGLQTYRYIRLNVDSRRLIIFNKGTSLAFRLNSGVAFSYDGDNVLPYEKYFFAGGSNSVRAWRPRRLGPGSYRPPESANPEGDGLYDYRNEQPGEFLIEGSAELRRKLFGFIEGALFLDLGNVWTIDERIKRDQEGNVVENGNSKFKLDQFYKEFGVGTGFGLRFNFSFLILRFDVGMKVYDPARVEGDRFVLNKVKFFKPFGTNKEPVIYNVGVGFPF